MRFLTIGGLKDFREGFITIFYFQRRNQMAKQTTSEKSEAKSAFCTNCGKPIDGGAKFCTSCGAAVSGKSAKTEAQNQEPQQAGRKKSFGLKLILLAAVIMLALAFVFFYSGGVGVGNPAVPDNPIKGMGELTITGLPSGQWVAQIYTAGTDVSKTAVREATGVTNSNVFSLVTWTGSGKREVKIMGGNDAVNRVFYRYATVYFINGSATVPFSSFIPVTIGKSGNNKR
jgi:hypothetical protein